MNVGPAAVPQRDGSRAGHGRVELRRVAGRTAITQCRADSPLKLLTPRPDGDHAWVFATTYGGGLVGGDAIGLDVDAGPDTRCLLSTQASTKIYRSAGAPCSQALTVSAAAGAVVVSAPDPIVCYADAVFEQRQRFDLATVAGLVSVDWLTSGRRARGERWAFHRYGSTTEVFVAGRRVFRDAILLDTADGPIGGEMRMGRVDCFATVVVVGPPVQVVADDLLRHVAEQPAKAEPICSASPIAGGAVARVAGRDVEAVGAWIRDRLAGLAGLVGQDLWRRKW